MDQPVGRKRIFKIAQTEVPVSARFPDKQAQIETTLQSVKGSKSYLDIENKIRSGIYRTNRVTRNHNHISLQKKKLRLTNKVEKGKSGQVKGDKAKIAKIDTLLSIIEDETNVENGNNARNKNEENQANNNESSPKEAPAVAPVAKENSYEDVIIKPTLAQGDCFYSAIFRSLNERDNLLENVSTCLSIDISDETSFIKTFRDKLADDISEGHLDYSDEKNGRIDTYDYFVELILDPLNYKEVTKSYPPWFNNEFGKSGEKLGERKSFCLRLADHIRKLGEWVGEIEVRLIKKMLERCHIQLEVETEKKEKLSKKSRDMDVLYLYNPSEQHYEYFSFTPKVSESIEPFFLPEGTNVDPNKPVLKMERNCNELFDPCTREPIENGDIDILERRVRDIKKQRLVDVLDKVAFPDNIKNRLDLLLFILNRHEKPNENLLQYNNNGQLYESYWDIVFTLGLIDTFPINKDFYMFNGKIETLLNIDGEGFSNNPLTYLQSKKVNEGSKSGASDITFVYKKNKSDLDIDLCSSDPSIKVLQTCKKVSVLAKTTAKETPQFFFCSSKYFNRDASKGVDKFDIQNIYTAAKSLDQEYDRKIILLVKDKGAVEEKLRKAIRKYISEEASYVYGMDDLFASLTSLYDYIHSKHNSIEKLTAEIVNRILKLELPPKPILRLRLHQYLATYKICDAIKRFATTRVNNKFLVGIVPRGGKTFIAGGIIDKLNPKRVVVLLGAKSETLSQFKKDLFEEFQNFIDYECIDVVNTTDMAIDPSKKYIFIMSVELYKQADSTRRLLQELKGGANRADLFICDEAHLKQTTARAVKQMEMGTVALKVEEEEVSEEAEESQLKELDKQIQADIPVVYMTGTYIKPLKAFNIPDENVVIWDYQDIQKAKEL